MTSGLTPAAALGVGIRIMALRMVETEREILRGIFIQTADQRFMKTAEYRRLTARRRCQEKALARLVEALTALVPYVPKEIPDVTDQSAEPIDDQPDFDPNAEDDGGDALVVRYNTGTVNVRDLNEGDVFTVNGVRWHTCAVPLFGNVAVYTDQERGEDAPTIRVDTPETVTVCGNEHEYASQILTTIGDLVHEGVLPATTAKWEDLHRHVDANEFTMDLEVPWGRNVEPTEADPDGYRITVAIENEVDRRLKEQAAFCTYGNCNNSKHDHTTTVDRDGMPVDPPIPMLCTHCGVPTHYDGKEYRHDDPNAEPCFLIPGD
jgi:hypothetical protein